MKLCVATVTAAILVTAAGHAADLFGVPRVVDGDTLVIGSSTFASKGLTRPRPIRSV